jgi:hypothetical protein
MSVNAKFKVSRVTEMPWASPDNPCREVELTPDYANGANHQWSKATPSGVCRMTITNPAAFEQFEQGRSFTVTFEAEE